MKCLNEQKWPNKSQTKIIIKATADAPLNYFFWPSSPIQILLLPNPKTKPRLKISKPLMRPIISEHPYIHILQRTNVPQQDIRS
jgi:hypothetical protein